MNHLKSLYLADLTAFAVCALGMSIGHAPTVTASALIGVGASSVLMVKVPDKKSKESEILDKLLESQSKVEALQTEKEWELKLAKSQLEKELSELKAAHETELQAIEKASNKLIENERELHRDYVNSLTAKHEKKEKTYQAKITDLEDKLAVVNSELSALKATIEPRERAVREQSEQLTKFKSDLEKANTELGFREKELRIEEKRIKVDVKEYQGNIKETLKNAELDLQVQTTINARLQAELSEIKQINRQLWHEKFSLETDETTAKIQAVLAANGCPTELIESNSTSCKLKPLSLDGWDKKDIESACQQIPAFANLSRPPKVEIRWGCIELLYDYQEQSKALVSKIPKFYDWTDAKTEASGFVVCGNTGAGKTAVVLWLLGLLTEDEPKQIIVLDVHARMNHWHEHGLTVIHKQDEVINALRAILAELKRRKEEGICSPELIVVLDEVAATRLNAYEKEDKQFINDALLLLGAEGRKFGIILIAMNQSKNVAALGIDGQNRNNYFLVLLCAAARDWAEYEWGKNDERTVYTFDTPYSCVVSGCVSDSIAIHPTHGEYHKFQKKGLAPKNLKTINALTPELSGFNCKPATPVKCEIVECDAPADSQPDKLTQIKRFWAEGERNLTVIIPAIWGCPGSGRAYRKARKEYRELTGE